MPNKLNITEEDIFYFVFFIEQLDETKRKYIERNEHLFRNQIDFLSAFLEEDVDKESIKKNVSKNFPHFAPKFFDLFPVKYEVKHDNTLKFAASSEVKKKDIEVTSFKDENSEFLARLVRIKDSLKLFIYHQASESLPKLKITIFPSEKEFYLGGLSGVLELNPKESVEKIRIEPDQTSLE